MKAKKWAIKSLVILVVFLLLAGTTAAYFDWKNNFAQRIYPDVRVGSLDLSGKTSSEAQSLIAERTDKIVSAGLTFQAGNKNVVLDAGASSFDADLSFPALLFDTSGTADRALNVGQPKNFFRYLLFRLQGNNKKLVAPVYTIDETKIKNFLAESFKDLNIEPANSSFSMSPKNGALQASPEKVGKEINYDLVFAELKGNLDKLENYPIVIKTHSKYPAVSQNDLASLTGEAQSIIKDREIKLIFSEPGTSTSSAKTWTIKPERLLSWVSVSSASGRPRISLDQTKIQDYLNLNVAPEINIESVRPRFEIANGKVKNWQAGKEGRQLDIEASAAKVVEDFFQGNSPTMLIVKAAAINYPDSGQTINIKELLGTGVSDFSGSPTNRRKNIQVGANAVHGVLLAPGEEFSLVKTLGDVSEKTGYFPELVIKGDKTLPEFGGGLCQIATTIFRAALASGLPITERRNHSYRVVYYEPAGTDAAVYLPKPDVRFINDTANYILIQSRIIGNKAYFDFWGTKDGRVATTSAPTIYNIVKPAPTKYIESSSIPAGEKKCTEKAHNGADAYFDYKVIYPEGATTSPIQEKRFSSHYVPWQEVCLIGKSATSTTGIAASSSAPSISTSTAPEATAATSTSN